MHCTKCGFENQNGVVFCSSCGSKFESQQNSRYQGSYDDNQAPMSAPLPGIADAESQSVASLVLGIIGIIAGIIVFFVGIILGSIAISKGKQARRVLDDSNHNFWIALAGVITGTISIVVSIVFLFFWLCYIIIIVGMFSAIM